MKNYKAIIVEDIANEAKYLSGSLKKLFPDIEILAVCDTLSKAKKDIERFQPQLLFLDIDIGTESGFDLLKQLTVKSFKVIFTTSHPDKILDALRVSAVDYLHKPYSEDDLVLALNRAVEKLETENISEISGRIDVLINNLKGNNNFPTTLVLVNKDGEHRVPINDIILCSTVTQISPEGNAGVRVAFRILNRESVIVSNTSISYYEEILKPYHFFRVGSPYLINMHHIKIYQRKGSKLLMKGYQNEQSKMVEEDIYISDSKKDAFHKSYSQFGTVL